MKLLYDDAVADEGFGSKRDSFVGAGEGIITVGGECCLRRNALFVERGMTRNG